MGAFIPRAQVRSRYERFGALGEFDIELVTVLVWYSWAECVNVYLLDRVLTSLLKNLYICSTYMP